MKSRRAPVIVKALDDGFERPPREETDPYDDVQMNKVLKELSFIRIRLEEIVLPGVNPFLQKLHIYRELIGFQLEYTFPCLEAVSKSLKNTIKIPEKDLSAVKISFNHRRIVLVDLHPDQIEQWKKQRLTIHLLVNRSINERLTIRPLAKCHIPLAELVYPPYIIHRDFDFVGEEFEGTAEIRIDLGSRVKTLMEKLNNLRGERSQDDTFVVLDKSVARRTRSRSSSRCRAHSAASGAPREQQRASIRPHSATSSSATTSVSETPILVQRPAPPDTSRGLLRPRIASSSSIGSDSVFSKVSDRVFVEDVPPPPPPRERICRTVTESYGASTVGDTVEEVTRHGGKYFIEVTVHEAIGLPPVEDESGRLVSPSSFISILGRDGDLRSPVYPNSRDPRWNFVARFALSSERRNLVIKVNHRDGRGDSALGYVTIPLPTMNINKSVYEMTDVTRMAVKYTSQVPMITLSLEKLRVLDDVEYTPRMPSRPASPPRRSYFDHEDPIPMMRPPRYESPPIPESSEVIKERMQRCMADLENMMKGINK